ncbi:MAG: hypothetical protein LBC02_00445, partial [Planctomycetaceae bacterium]|nr:hypothetical protein [Planctomycetaceae bacterium]
MKLANEVWFRMLQYHGERVGEGTFLLRVFSHDTAKKVDELRLRPQYYDNGAVSTVIAKFDGLMSFCSYDIINHYQKNLTESNLRERFELFLNTARYWEVDDEYQSFILPLTIESKIELREGIIINWFHSTSPTIDVHLSRPLAVRFENLGLYDKAWRVQFEMGRSRGYDQYDPHRGSTPFHSYYVDIANAAYRSGNKKLGWSFLMNAAVFEHKKSFELAMETARLWIDVESGKKELPKQKILTGDERKKTFLEIVDMYQQNMKAHPRAWMFIQEYKNEFDDADNLIKKIQDDWLKFVKIAQYPEDLNITKRIVMYGVELYPAKNDPLSVKVPWPFPEGSIEKLKARIQEVANKIKDEEKASGGLMDWYFASGKLAARAKYISCNDKEVIVERENGKKGTIEIAKLSDFNKNYIYRRLAIRNIAVEDFCTLFHKWNLAGKKLAEVEAKYLSLDKENKITLELKDGKKEIINLSDLNKIEQEYVTIWESWQAKKRAEQKQQLADLRKQLLSEVKFRQWKSADEYFNTKAKFISYDYKTQTVTIEKPDGKQTSMEYNDLCDEDKKY